MFGSQEPIWVVDGVIQEDPLPFSTQTLDAQGGITESNFVGNSISWLNPMDIDRITVLKDASATAIYGTKAANGVIVIASTSCRGLPVGGELNTSNTNQTTWSWRNSLQFDHVYNKVHAVTAMLGMEMSDTRYKGYSDTRYGYLPERGKSFAQLPATVTNPYSNSAQANPLYENYAGPAITDTKTNNMGLYLTLNYAYDNRYVANMSVRGDASTYPDFYKAAVASSGNYDNTVYNRMWGETYQGIADDNARFSVKTVQELAPRLKGHLMLATGDVDQNVHPIHTQRLVEALINANKDFDLLVLPGQQHHYDFTHQMYFERRKRDFFERWLK